MKIAHFTTFGPHQCGLYHTAKDMILAERSAGIDAGMIAYSDKFQGICKDGSFDTVDLKWAYNADILVRHSAIPTHLQCAGIPIIMALHGRPESSFRLAEKGNPVIEMLANKVHDCRYKGFVTFWPEYVSVWKTIIPESKLFYVPAMLNLDEYKPVSGGDRILICDMWREDVTPFNTLFSAAQAARQHGLKVDIAGLPEKYLRSLQPILNGMKDVLGTVACQTKHIMDFYNRAKIVVTPHVIATRVIREALACNLPVVAGSGCKYTQYTANSMDIESFAKEISKCIEECSADKPRQVAIQQFGLEKAGQAIKVVFENILTRRPKGRKLFIDVGSHLGESVRRFYREVEDADLYEIYCFEPDMETFKQLDANVGHIKNVNLINAMAGVKDGLETFYPAANNNEGGTTLQGKLTGGVNYTKPTTVESIDFNRWLQSNVNDGDKVILKVNIEGGEYNLMEHMLGKTDGLIDTCYMQLHAHKFDMGQQRSRFQKIESEFYEKAKCKCLFKNKGFYPFE